jgi:simple sugar transport system permease protein
LAAAALAGGAVAICFAAVAIWGRTDQIIAGTALTLGSIGVTGVLYQRAFGAGGIGLDLPRFAPVPIPGLEKIPVVGPAFFSQPWPTYLALVAAGLVGWVLFRTTLGLELRATGEAAGAASASGLPVRRIQAAAVLFGGVMAGIGGGTLVLAQVGSFAERMTAGRGFIAIAIVVLGRWHPAGVVLAALGFGAASSLQFAFQAMGLAVPYQFFLMLPYVVALLALAGLVGRARAPGGLGKAL